MVKAAHRKPSRPSARAIFVVVASALLAGGCATGTPASGRPTLTGTEWRLDYFESSDDAIGTIRPAEGEIYTLRLAPDGSAAMGLFCNRGTGRWTSSDAHLERGSLMIEPLASTMAACPPSRLEQLSADLARIRSFVIADGRLHLNLMLDGGNYVWVPGE